ncbi:MAG: riboflavin biosynthesis protein RibF [Gammaproteobacteria bacterium]|nr:riboflavin biosynthesis protein RibF [Gammaproteobacteria bacterium]MYF52437.1 riboflavin biosynthesis protein RibF [Gammaproteobacteria bacterium]MYK43134.1 riboflavin biosynthesis protein RibF [Gammaproteobacteria bacterium]
MNTDRGGTCTVGTFDGIHLGHQRVITTLVNRAIEFGTHPLVILFEPQPNEYFLKTEAPPRLTSFREKLVLLADLGVQHVLCIRFDESTRSMTADSFIRTVLVDSLKIKHLVVGRDFKFGRQAKGNIGMLRSAAHDYEFTVEQVDDLEIQDTKVSSTRLRKAFECSDFSLVRSCLGRSYFIQGRVVKGRQLGTTLGVPTVNIPLNRSRSPLEGVFAVTIDGIERTHFGAAYIGSANSGSSSGQVLEVHIFDFDRDVYGSELRITFLKKFRADRQFDDNRTLREYMLADIRQIKQWIQATVTVLAPQNS